MKISKGNISGKYFFPPEMFQIRSEWSKLILSNKQVLSLFQWTYIFRKRKQRIKIVRLILYPISFFLWSANFYPFVTFHFMPQVFCVFGFFFLNFALIQKAKILENKCLIRFFPPTHKNPSVWSWPLEKEFTLNTLFHPERTTWKTSLQRHAKLLQTGEVLQELPQLTLFSYMPSTREAEKIPIEWKTHFIQL